jgi:hypothetical protein
MSGSAKPQCDRALAPRRLSGGGPAGGGEQLENSYIFLALTLTALASTAAIARLAKVWRARGGGGCCGCGCCAESCRAHGG